MDFVMIPLFSGSSGNSILVKVNGLNLLFDCGQSCKRIDNALNSVGTDPDSIDALFLTHGHGDHISGADVFIRKHPTSVYATEGTFKCFLASCKKEHSGELDNIVDMSDIIFDSEGGEVRIKMCATPHDAQGSVCYKIESCGRSAMIMTDLGHVTEDIRSMAIGCDAVLIESNYDYDMLITGPYDYMLKRRVGGPNGHLSNEDCAKTVKDLIENGTRKFILGHLSQVNNLPEIALRTTVEYLEGFDILIDRDYSIQVANRYEPSIPVPV